MSDEHDRYREIFERTPVALWEEDFTEVCARIDDLKASGISNWRQYFDEHPDVVVELASKVQILDINDYSIELYEAESKDEMLTSVDKTFDPDSFPVFKEQLIALAEGAKLFRAECYSRTLRGQRLHVLVQVQMLGRRCNRVRALLSLIDITMRKELEVALCRMNLELERSNQELEHFAYVASHDLQEPLRMVASYTQLLAKRYQGKLDERADKYVHYIVDGAKRMQVLVSDLLQLSRVGTQGKELRPVACSDILAGVLTGMKVVLEEKNAEVSYGKLPRVMADPSQLSLVLQNLISNAVKFCTEGTPRVQISAQVSGPDWILAVRDNGIGIAEKNVASVFEVFKRLHGRDEYPGTGMGLAIAKKIVERHGGRIWVESVPGQGSTFYFSLVAAS